LHFSGLFEASNLSKSQFFLSYGGDYTKTYNNNEKHEDNQLSFQKNRGAKFTLLTRYNVLSKLDFDKINKK
jgi:hypothetical protein